MLNLKRKALKKTDFFKGSSLNTSELLLLVLFVLIGVAVVAQDKPVEKFFKIFLI